MIAEPSPVSPEVKDEVRRVWRRRRRELPFAERARQSAAVADALRDWLAARPQPVTVAAYLAYGAEPTLEALLESLHDDGATVLVPVCLPERQLGWVHWSPGAPTQRSTVAPIDEPVGHRGGVETAAAADVVLVPAQAVDLLGARLGQGGGYYDRFIAQLRAGSAAPALLAVVYDHELATAGTLPAGPLDEPVDGVVTSRGIAWFAR
ncbi:5-formyltetrahydrofolate cyclo-ligase [Kocuria polaris]|nr:5-formyltetrahydrofolate cyclo-ligase [Kocuria polaris]